MQKKNLHLISAFVCFLTLTTQVSAETLLNSNDRRALNLQNSVASHNIPPYKAQDGSIRFTYGAATPTLVCAVLQVCDIQLQTGEVVNNIHLGDTVRWSIEPAVTGDGSGEVMHIIVKPFDANLRTNMIITTNRRTYHLDLKSTANEFMSSISFAYPEDINATLQRQQTAQRVERETNTIPATGEYLADLDFNYEISGSASWKPVRVYNNGQKTIIELPPSALNGEVPTFLGLERKGGLFSDDQYYMINYRLQNNRFIVDAVFQQAVLITGVGRNQTRVIITRKD